MTYRYRKSIKLIPGVKLNLSKSGISTSIGKRGATINIGHGRVKSTVGLPGSGISYSKSTTTRNASSVRQQTARATQPKVPREDKQVLDAISAGDIVRLDAVARKGKSEHALPAGMLAGIIALESNPVWGRQMLEWVWSQGHDPGEYRLIKTYLSAVRLPVQITPEIEIEEALGRSLVGLMIAEWKQSSGDPFGALQIVEQLEPTSGVVLSLCDLYAQTESYDQIIELTDGLTNQDDVTALLLVFRGQAFRQLGHNESARLVLTEALRARSRASEIRFRALVERALAYHADGKKGMARKDLDRIRAEDASYPGLAEAFTALGLDTVVPEPDQVADASVISPTTPIPLPPPHLR